MYLSLCLIAKDENTYIQEWLDYHILMGVEHFWIYDNESVEPLADSLKEYIDRGLVTVNRIKGRAMQLYAYDHCIQTYGGHSNWIGFIDTDEFLVVHSGEMLPVFLKNYEEYGGLAVSSLFFGHGGNKKRPIGGQIAAYQKRAPDKFSYSRLVKSIVQPRRIIFPSSPHSFFYKEGWYCVNEDFNRVDAQEYPCHVKKIQLNHYFTRSQEEWNQKLARGRGDSAVGYKDERGTWLQNFTSVRDTAILDYLQNRLNRVPRDRKTWMEKIRPNSRYLIDLLHRQALDDHSYKSSSLSSFAPSGEITPRREAVEYYKSLETSITLYENGNFREACLFWQNQIEKYPFDPNRYLNYADAAIRAGEMPFAWNALAQAWRIAPKSLYVMMSMVEYFYAAGDYAQAEKTSLLCASLGDLKPEGLAMLAISQFRLGKIDDAHSTARPLLEQIINTEVKKPIFLELIRLFSNPQVPSK